MKYNILNLFTEIERLQLLCNILDERIGANQNKLYELWSKNPEVS